MLPQKTATGTTTAAAAEDVTQPMSGAGHTRTPIAELAVAEH